MIIALTVDDIFVPPGGAQKVVSLLANKLVALGHKVFIIIRAKVLPDYPLPFYLDQRVQVIGLEVIDNHGPQPKKNFLDIIKGFFLINILKNLIYRILNIFKLDKKIWLQQNEVEISKYQKVLQEISPDIVILSLPETFIPFYQSFNGQSKTVIIHHSNPRVGYDKKFFPNIYELSLCRQAIRRADVNVVLDDLFVKYFSGRVAVIANFIDFVQPQITIPKQKIIISVGRLVANKNHLLLIKAFNLLKEKYPDWQVHIYGQGALKNFLERYIQRYKLENQVKLFGEVSNQELYDKYLEATVCAFPSRYEGFGLGLVEAMYLSLPSVVLQKCLPPAKFITESDGGLIAQNNVYDFAKKLSILMSDKRQRERQGSNAQKYAQKFSEQVIFEKWQNLLNSLTAN